MCLPAAHTVVPNLFPSANTCMILSFEWSSLQVSGFVGDLSGIAERSEMMVPCVVSLPAHSSCDIKTEAVPWSCLGPYYYYR